MKELQTQIKALFPLRKYWLVLGQLFLDGYYNNWIFGTIDNATDWKIWFDTWHRNVAKLVTPWYSALSTPRRLMKSATVSKNRCLAPKHNPARRLHDCTWCRIFYTTAVWKFRMPVSTENRKKKTPEIRTNLAKYFLFYFEKGLRNIWSKFSVIWTLPTCHWRVV